MYIKCSINCSLTNFKKKKKKCTKIKRTALVLSVTTTLSVATLSHNIEINQGFGYPGSVEEI